MDLDEEPRPASSLPGQPGVELVGSPGILEHLQADTETIDVAPPTVEIDGRISRAHRRSAQGTRPRPRFPTVGSSTSSSLLDGAAICDCA